MKLKEPQEDQLIELSTMTAFELIDLLNQIHPPRCIAIGESLEQAHRYAGMRDLIEELVDAKRAETHGEN